MSLKEDLDYFVGNIATATARAPDNYPDWCYTTYDRHMADLKELWSKIRPKLKRDVDKAAWVDQTLQEMIAAFDAGNKESGRKAAWELYHADLEKLR